MTQEKKVLTAQEFRLIDASGNVRATLGADEQGVTLALMSRQSETKLKLSVNDDGLSNLKFFDAGSNSEKIDISVNAMGTHVHLAGDHLQQSYLFLKKDGATGVILIGKDGERNAQFTAGPDGQVQPTIFPSLNET